MNIVVIGGGLAGASAVEELRSQGYTEDITLIGAEAHLPYARPPLSKGLLLGSAEPASVFVHDAQWYADQQVDVLTDTTVTDVDLDTCHVSVTGGRIPYDRLLLATGAAPRQLPPPAAAGADLSYLRTLDDALALKARIAGHVLVIGAGWIGLEVAAAARHAGATVTVVENAALPLERVLGPEVAPLFAQLHREHGVDLRLSTSITGMAPTHGATEVHLSDGHWVVADLILVGIGAQPNHQLAAAAGLTTHDGVLVDARLRSSEPHVYAAGDVASHDHPVVGRVRVEHWDTAVHQGRHAARSMLGSDEPYVRLPYFFTDQYDLGMEYIGHVGPDGYDEIVIRGDLGNRVITAFWIRRNQVVAGMHINDWDSIDVIRRWVGQEATEDFRNLRLPLVDIAV